MMSIREGTLVVRYDQNKKFTRRHGIIRGSTLWLSKQPIVFEESPFEEKTRLQHLTGREEYVATRLSSDSSLSCPPSQQSPPFLIHVTGTPARETKTHSSITLSFTLLGERDLWLHSLETAKQHHSAQRADGGHTFLLDLAARMHHEVTVVDRFYHLIRYRKCFLGSEAVLWLIHDQKCSQEEAVCLGNRMIDMGLLHHVSHEHFLCNAYLFYRFDYSALEESSFYQSGSISSDEGHDLIEHDEELNKENDSTRGGHEALLHAVEDLEAENRALRGRLQSQSVRVSRQRNVIGRQLEDSINTLETLERLGVIVGRWLAVLLACLVLSPVVMLFLSRAAWVLVVALLVGAEYCTQTTSHYLHEGAVSSLKYFSCGHGDDGGWDLRLPSAILKERMQQQDRDLVDQEALETSEGERQERGSNESSVSISDESSIEFKCGGSGQLNVSDNNINSSRSNNSNWTFYSSLLIPPFSEWPNGPLLVRRSPDMFQVSTSRLGAAELRSRGGIVEEEEAEDESGDMGPRGHVCSQDMRMLGDTNLADMMTSARRGDSDDSGRIRGDDSTVNGNGAAPSIWRDRDRDGDGDGDRTSGSGFSVPSLLRPLQIHKTPSESSVFSIDNHLFKGKVFLVVAGLPDSPVDFFASKNRLFEVVVQGQFKEATPYSSVYNGQVFKKPFRNLPPKWMIRILVSLLSKIQPGLQVSLYDSTPYMVSSLIAGSKNVVVSLPGSEPDICVTDKGGTERVREDMTLLASSCSGDDRDHGRSDSCKRDSDKIFLSRSASKRAHYFSSLKNLDKFTYNPDHVYTFDFYQHVLNIGQLKLDLGFASLDVSSMIGFSPVQVMAVQWDPRQEPDMNHLEYFYNIEMWNRKSFPSDNFENE